MTASLSAEEIQQAAKGIVISFASVGPNSVQEAAAARQCFEGCNSLRWATRTPLILYRLRLDMLTSHLTLLSGCLAGIFLVSEMLY